MPTETVELRAIVERLEKVERENRMLKRVGASLLLIPVLLFATCKGKQSRTVEAEKLVLRDSKGHVGAEILPSGIRFLDDSGKPHTNVGHGHLELFKDDGTIGLTVLSDALQFEQRSAGLVGVRLGVSPAGGGELFMFGHDAIGGVLLKAGSQSAPGPTLELSDDKGSATLGSTKVKSPRTGWHRTSAASVVLTRGDGKVLWSAP